MNLIGKHVEQAMELLGQQAKELGFGRVTLWCHITTDVGWNEWTIFAHDDAKSNKNTMFDGRTFDEAFKKAQEFINNRKNAEVILSL